MATLVQMIVGVAAAVAAASSAIGQIDTRTTQRPAKVSARVVSAASAWRSSDRSVHREALPPQKSERPCDPSPDGATERTCRLIVTEIE